MVLFKMKFYLLFAIQLIVYAEIGKILVQGHQQFGQLKGKILDRSEITPFDFFKGIVR